jgi:multidrug efflux pump subunit AcrB
MLQPLAIAVIAGLLVQLPLVLVVLPIILSCQRRREPRRSP